MTSVLAFAFMEHPISQGPQLLHAGLPSYSTVLIAESEGHHPRLTVEWGRVGVEWWTHKIKGLHRNDFIMASKTETLFEQTMETAG